MLRILPRGQSWLRCRPRSGSSLVRTTAPDVRAAANIRRYLHAPAQRAAEPAASPPPSSAASPLPPPPTYDDLAPPVSRTTIRLVLALVFATGSVLFFRYIANPAPAPPAPAASPPSSAPLSSSVPASLPSRDSSVSSSITDAIGGTPLIELRSLSRLLNRRVLAKAEFLNPGGSVKDRTALYLLRHVDAERRRQWAEQGRPELPGQPKGTLVEATGGNTGVGLALLAPMFGYSCIFTYPSSISRDKVAFMEALGARCLPAPLVPFSDPRHFYHMAAAVAQVTPDAWPTLQFESLANTQAHYETTGPEILRQTGGRVNAFVCAAGTGGTISGVSQYLKAKDPRVLCYLIDPPNSGLFSWYTRRTWEGRPADVASVVEGIGTFRLTGNQAGALLDGALEGFEKEAIEMAWWLLKEEGVCVGASAALNVCGAVKVARTLPEGDTVVTVLCDSGSMYREKLYNPHWLREQGMEHVMAKRTPEQLQLDWIR